LLRDFLTPAALVRALAENRVPAAAAPAGLTVAAALQAAFGRPGLLTAPTSIRAVVLLQLALWVAAVWAAYIANGGREGRDFLLRYLTLGIVVWAWVAIAVVVVHYVLLAVLQVTAGPVVVDQVAGSALYRLLTSTVSYLAVIALVVVYFRRLRARTPNPEEPPRPWPAA
jgi:hypothetical protein